MSFNGSPRWRESCCRSALQQGSWHPSPRHVVFHTFVQPWSRVLAEIKKKHPACYANIPWTNTGIHRRRRRRRVCLHSCSVSPLSPGPAPSWSLWLDEKRHIKIKATSWPRSGMIRSFDEEFSKSRRGKPCRGAGRWRRRRGRGRSLPAASRCGRSQETDRASLMNDQTQQPITGPLRLLPMRRL